MSQTITLYFDLGGPYSYLAWSQCQRLAQQTGRTIEMQPVSHWSLMTAVGNTPTVAGCKPRRDYARVDLARWAKQFQVPIAANPSHGQYSAEPFHLAVLASEASGQKDIAITALFNAIWRDEADITSDGAMIDILSAAGVRDAEMIWNTKEQYADRFAQIEQQAIADGIFAPPAFVADGQVYFGVETIHFLEKECA